MHLSTELVDADKRAVESCNANAMLRPSKTSSSDSHRRFSSCMNRRTNRRPPPAGTISFLLDSPVSSRAGFPIAQSESKPLRCCRLRTWRPVATCTNQSPPPSACHLTSSHEFQRWKQKQPGTLTHRMPEWSESYLGSTPNRVILLESNRSGETPDQILESSKTTC